MLLLIFSILISSLPAEPPGYAQYIISVEKCIFIVQLKALVAWHSYIYTHTYTHITQEIGKIYNYIFFSLIISTMSVSTIHEGQLPSSPHAHSQEWDSAVLFEQSFLSPAELTLTLQFAQFAFWKLPSSSF